MCVCVCSDPWQRILRLQYNIYMYNIGIIHMDTGLDDNIIIFYYYDDIEIPDYCRLSLYIVHC